LKASNCQEAIAIAFLEAGRSLGNGFGKDMEQWTYGNLHSMMHQALPLSAIPVIGRFFIKKTPLGGNHHTPFFSFNYLSKHESCVDCKTESLGRNSANYRQVIEFCTDCHSTYSIDTGVSESFLSPFFLD
jgi:hypothetical protein